MRAVFDRTDWRVALTSRGARGCITGLAFQGGRRLAGVRVAVDIGGTFTDIVVMARDGALHASKLATTPEDPCRAVVSGLAELFAKLAIPAAAVSEVLHGTTVGSNALLERTGARTRLITTRGF